MCEMMETQRRVRAGTLLMVGTALVVCYLLYLVFIEGADLSYILAVLLLMSVMALPVIGLALWFLVRRVILKRHRQGGEGLSGEE